ncbi:MAG: Zeta toxin family protein [Deltaproteobacteria bacterium]|nr:MAG: Zeta toxin family protein [Deltaproteobacteria bacterium]
MHKKCYIIAGPNGAGKTTFANEFLPIEGACLNFINADLIAKGLSPFQPEKVALKAGKLMIQQMNEVTSKGESFAVETTFSGLDYLNKMNNWKSSGYFIIVYYLKLQSVELAIKRVKLRASKGGHNIPENVIRRRYEKSWYNFQQIYKHLADVWTVFDNSGNIPVIVDGAEG